MAGTARTPVKEHGFKSEVVALREEHNKVVTDLDALRTRILTKCITPPNFEIDTNFDIQNGDAFEYMVSGKMQTLATDQNWDTGTSTVVTTNAYWAAGVLSIDDDNTTYVNWGSEGADEATAISNLSSVTASGECVCGYVTVHAASGQDWVAGTDALTTGSGGQVAQATNYYNIQDIGDAALGTISAATVNA